MFNRAILALVFVITLILYVGEYCDGDRGKLEHWH